MAKVLVGMSGGVDSAVAAALLQRQGHEVIGITMYLWADESDTNPQGCCGLSAADDAHRIAVKLGFPHYVINLRELFEGAVIENFIREYAEGRTPNPCVRCNRYVKFQALLKHARQLDAEYIATGHYAEVKHDEGRDRWTLRRANAVSKDQTYALYSLTQDQLAHTLFPLSGLESKADTRRIAEELGLPVAGKPDSQEICFIPSNDYRAFLRQHGTATPGRGALVNLKGEVVGAHEGVENYTRGQRKGIGAHGPEAMYVVDVRPSRNEVVIGPGSALLQRRFAVDEVNWVGWDGPGSLPRGLTAKVRYNMQAEPCVLFEEDGQLWGEFSEPVRAITPGQCAVFYHGEEVVCGGIIRSEPEPV